MAILTFLGAAGTVTGSRFLVETPDARVLVDAGLFQGLKELRLRNWQPFPIDPATIDAIVITHAHVDHVGYLPALVRDGFRGPVYATPGTIDLAAIVLVDCGHLQEEEADYANRKGFSKHKPAKPLYTEEDARRSLDSFVAVDFGIEREVAPGVFLTMRHAGHILGSASPSLRLAREHDRVVAFSGDLGRPSHPILRPPEPIGKADVIVIESTYGDRHHDDESARIRFRDAIATTAARGGTVLIPAFAVDRTEVILLRLAQLMRDGEIPRLPIYVDSPMALATLGVYRRAIDRGDDEVKDEAPGIDDGFDPGQLVEIREMAASVQLANVHYPSIIVSASGMATGGRVIHHLERLLPDRRNTLILAGFQAPGTRGRLLADGATQVKMLGHYVRVRADIVEAGAFSVHADQAELLGWLGTVSDRPDAVYVVHGEPRASDALCEQVESRFDWQVIVPRQLERVRLD
jgi:metallo-beta-lactamase family protein